MKLPAYLNRSFLMYLIRFLLLFTFLYYFIFFFIGFTSPGGYYNAYLDQHFNFIKAFRKFLLLAAQVFLNLIGYHAYLANEFVIRLQHGNGVRLVYSCLGYGVLSFWTAFVIANEGRFFKKVLWVIGGSLMICLINILRISFLLLSNNKIIRFPFGMDHHLLYNIFVYVLIFILIGLYDRSMMKTEVKKTPDSL